MVGKPVPRSHTHANILIVDICIQTPMKRLEEMHMLAEALDKRMYSQGRITA